MGLFDSICAESGLVIEHEQRLIPIVEVGPSTWRPAALPIAGTNDRGGTMDVPRKLDPAMKLTLAWGKTLTYADERVAPAKVKLDGVLDEIRGDGSGAKRGQLRASFALIDRDIYQAIVAAVTANGATAWKRYAQVGLALVDPPLPHRVKPKAKAKAKAPVLDATCRRLCEEILADPDNTGVRQVYVDRLLELDDPRGKLLALVPRLKKARAADLAAIALHDPGVCPDPSEHQAALVELVRFLAWGTRLEAACGEGQFFGYEDPDDDFDDGWARPYCDRARTKYAGMPELLRAVEANAKAWRARQADD